MHDPFEGVTPSGFISTGAKRGRVSHLFERVLDGAVDAVRNTDPAASVYLYGSVATGMARPGASDVDLLTIGIAPPTAADIGRALSGRFSDLCRSVELAPAQAVDFTGDGDAAYGGKVFLRHYCVHLAGPDLQADLPDFPADVRAARGLNGDIARHAQRWRSRLGREDDPARLGRRMGRKTLLAVAGLVGVHDHTWTTDRARAAARWAEVEPPLADGLSTLLAWANGAPAHRGAVADALDGVVSGVVDSFEAAIGLWR